VPRRRQTAAPALGRRCRLVGCAAVVRLRRAASGVPRELSLRGFVEVRGAAPARARGIDAHAVDATRTVTVQCFNCP
jgi:hypothetical protein